MIFRWIRRHTKGKLPSFYSKHFKADSDVLILYKPTNGVMKFYHNISDLLPIVDPLNVESFHYIDGIYYIGTFKDDGTMQRTSTGKAKTLMDDISKFILS